MNDDAHFGIVVVVAVLLVALAGIGAATYADSGKTPLEHATRACSYACSPDAVASVTEAQCTCREDD